MNNTEATHLLVILFAIAIVGMVVLRRTEVENEPFFAAIGRGLGNIGKNAGKLFGKGGKAAKKGGDLAIDWSGSGIPSQFKNLKVKKPPSGIGQGFKNVGSWFGRSIKNDPWNFLSLPFLAMMFVPAGGGEYAEEEGGSGGPSAGSMSSVAVVVSGAFFFCMCMSMMMVMASSSSS